MTHTHTAPHHQYRQEQQQTIMVVGYFISKVPFSNHIPVVRRFHPKNNQHQQQQQQEMDFVTPTSSKKTTNVVLDDGKIFDSPNRKKNHLPSVDNSSTVKVSQRLARRRKNQNIGPVSIKSKSNKRLINENESSDQQKNMIDKNNDGVLCSSNKSTNEKLIKLVYDNKKIIASSVYQIGKAQLSSRLPYIPYFNTKSDSQLDSFDQTNSGILNSPFTDYCQQVTEYEVNEPFIEEPLDDEELVYDNLASDLNSEDDVEIFVDSLNVETKMMLYKLLQNDLKDHSCNNEETSFREVYYNKNVSSLDKLQMFLIIWIKLWITSIKLFIPITKYLIYKFQNNQLFLFNLKNIELIIDLILRFMNYLNSFISNHEVTIDKMSNHDYVEAEQIYLDFTTYTSGIFNQTNTFKDLIFSPDIGQNKLYDLVLNTK